MLNNLTVRTSLLAVVLSFTAMLVIGAALGLSALSEANQAMRTMHAITASVVTINDAYKDTTRIRTALARGYVAVKETHNPADRAVALTTAQKAAQRTLEALAKFDGAPLYPGQDPMLKKDLSAAGQALSAVLARAAAAITKDDAETYSTVNFKEITPTGATFSALLEKFEKQGDEQLTTMMASREQEYSLVTVLVVVGLTVALLMVVGVHFMLRRIVLAPLTRAVALLDQVSRGDLTAIIGVDGDNEIARLLTAIRRMQQSLAQTVASVRRGAEVIDVGAHELASGNLELSSRTESQASSLEETAAAIEELTSTVRHNSDNAQHARGLVEGASTTAVQGGAVMQEVVATMNDINASSRKIVDITSVIDSIAFQTNILALNAAVEAARAGEQGRGFAVVASEVRNLAQRSASAAKEIKALIDQSVNNIHLGTTLVEKAGVTMETLVGNVHQVKQIVGEIAVASREQSEGIDQVNQAIVQMDQVTQQNAALVEEAAAATQSLQDQAAELTAAVSIFKIDMARQEAGARAMRQGPHHLALT